MVTLDFTPIYRSTIGFDRMARLLESSARLTEADNGYPPYNIETIGEDHYRITLAVAGFSTDDLDMEVREGTLVISGRKKAESDAQFLHRGIANRAFTKQFSLADHVKVEGASLDNGLLTVDLVREIPEEMKPRSIKIDAASPKSLKDKTQKMLGGDKKAA